MFCKCHSIVTLKHTQSTQVMSALSIAGVFIVLLLKASCGHLIHSSPVLRTDVTELPETRSPLWWAQRREAACKLSRVQKCVTHCHYCCSSSGGHTEIIWKSIPKEPPGLSCSSAVGQYGLSGTTSQFKDEACASVRYPPFEKWNWHPLLLQNDWSHKIN